MKNSLNKVTVLAATATSILATILTAVNPAQAIDLDFSFEGVNGYSATGDFSYDETKAPQIISESGAGPTSTLQTFSISFFDPAGNLLESGSSVVNGVSSDSFFRFDYNTQTQQISELDADIGGTSYQYFLTDLRTLDGQAVTTPLPTFNFFYRPNADSGLDSSPVIRVAAASVPEPTMSLATLVAGGLFVALRRKKVAG